MPGTTELPQRARWGARNAGSTLRKFSLVPARRFSALTLGAVKDTANDVHGIQNIAKQLRDREISAVDLTASYLRRIQQTNGTLNSFVALDTDLALAQAKMIDDELSRGIDRGILAGIPIAVKDNICTKDLPTTAGSNALAGYIPPYDATVVRRLLHAGAIIVGKTNMDEFGMGSTSESSYFNATRNPWDQACVPGGSSGGSAAAVASKQCVAALGSDTGGSVRQPASHCGVVGLKPTYGAISRNGLMAYASSFDCVGTLTSCVEDCAIMFNTLSRHRGHDDDLTRINTNVADFFNLEPISNDRPLCGYRFGIVRQALEGGIAEEVLNSFLDSIDLLRDLGAEVDTISCDTFMDGLPAYYILALSEASSNLARYDGIREGSSLQSQSRTTLCSSTRSKHLGSEVKRRILMGTYTLSAGYADAYYERANKVRETVANELQSKLRTYNALLTPVATTVAPKLNVSLKNPLEMYTGDAMTVNVNLSGLPALVVRGKPAVRGTTVPIGFQLIGRAFGEIELLKVGSIFEKAAYERFNIQPFTSVENITKLIP